MTYETILFLCTSIDNFIWMYIICIPMYFFVRWQKKKINITHLVKQFLESQSKVLEYRIEEGINTGNIESYILDEAVDIINCVKDTIQSLPSVHTTTKEDITTYLEILYEQLYLCSRLSRDNETAEKTLLSVSIFGLISHAFSTMHLYKKLFELVKKELPN